ncbi:MAG: GIY-YIG nuclease family protein [Spirulina sp.]
MMEHLISVKDFAEKNGLHKQTVFKVLKRLEIEPSKSRGGNQHRGQTISYITEEDGRRVLESLAATRSTQDGQEGEEDEFTTEAALYDLGVFYLLILEPEHDPTRFKVGFASNLNERLRQHRCSAPYTQVIKAWPCRRLWEKTAIECVTEGCERLHTEVFRAPSLQAVEERCEKFFALMPNLTRGQSA